MSTEMTREEAFEIAKENLAAFTKADIEVMFGRAPKFDAFKEFGFRHGWYHVGGFSFDSNEIRGLGPCQVQAAFAYL